MAHILVFMILFFYTVAVDCGPLTDPTNGFVTVPITTFGSTATYTCITGYTVTGDMTRTCGAGGMWSGSDPTCTRKLN